VGFRVPEGLDPARVVLYGEPLFVARVAEALDLALLEPALDFLPTLPQELRLRSVRLLTLAAARLEPGPVFLKPADEKCFAAKVYNHGTELPALPHWPADTPVLASEPVLFTVEFRCFILERALAALSPYVRGGALALGPDGAWSATEAETAGARACCERLLADPRVALPPAVVVDVGQVEGRGFAVVEANVAWASGLCDCSPEAVLPVLRRACCPRAALPASDGP
jgi:hypothetical protein